MKRVIGGIASIPERVESLRLAVESILPHVDYLYVALNGYTNAPAFLDRAKVATCITVNDRGDANKFMGFDHPFTFMSFDDDLTYTPEYFDAMYLAMEDRPGIISLHGRKIVQPFHSYYKSTTTYRCLGPLNVWQHVDFGGTGVMAIPANTLGLIMDDFPIANMADVWVGILAKRNGVPIWVPPHTGKEVRHNNVDLSRSIYASMRPKELDRVVREQFIEATPVQ